MSYGKLYSYNRATRTIRPGIIWDRMRILLDPDNNIGVDALDPLTDFFVGENPNKILPDMINEQAGFAKDNIHITISDLAKASTVHQVVAVIIQRYKDNKWDVRIG